MLKRRVQPAGKSSLAVLIPRDLARAFAIEKGDVMAITVHGKQITFEKIEGEPAPTGSPFATSDSPAPTNQGGPHDK